MRDRPETIQRLTSIPNLIVSQDVPLSRYTRFGVGGPAAVLAETGDEEAFCEALRTLRRENTPHVVIGDGTNLVVSDQGYDGVVLRLTANRISADGVTVQAAAGASLRDLVDFTIDHGLAGLETMTGIPGSVGAAVYGNAGAYGHSISESVRSVRFFDGRRTRSLEPGQCEFRYRESVFKRRRDWVVLSVTLVLQSAPAGVLRRAAAEIREMRDRKYPPTMRCAGSIFKNLLLAELPSSVAGQVPPRVVREGKVASAFFLEQVGAKGTRRGDIQVAGYHANLIYNDGQGTAADLRAVIADLKLRVRDRFGLELEEEVQYLGF